MSDAAIGLGLARAADRAMDRAEAAARELFHVARKAAVVLRDDNHGEAESLLVAVRRAEDAGCGGPFYKSPKER